MSVLKMKQKKQRYPSGFMLQRYGGLILTITSGRKTDNGLLWNGNAIFISPENARHAVQNFGINPPLAIPNDPRFCHANIA